MSVWIGPKAAAAFSVAFALLLFAGVAAINVPHSATDSEMVEWWSKSGNLNSAITSMYLVMGAALAFVPLLVHLGHRLDRESDGTRLALVALGMVFVGLLAGSAAARGVIGQGVQVNDEPLPGVDTLRYFPQLSYALMDMALIAAGVLVLATAWTTIRAKAMATWFGWASAAAGLALVLATPVIGPLTLPVLWVWAVAAAAAIWNPGIQPALHATGRPVSPQA
jgi:hypothetical protein